MYRSCPVNQNTQRISALLAQEQVAHSACRHSLELLLSLLGDISAGRGEPDHIPSIEAIARDLQSARHPKECIEIGGMLMSDLASFYEVFKSHIETFYCPTGECTTLSAAPCQLACPASVDVPSYVALVGMGRYQDALEILREDLSLPGILGRICVHPCERACRRGKVDTAIAICRLKWVAVDKAYEEKMELPSPPPNRFKEKVAIIGSGPAGLSTGYFLAKMGYKPTVFESMPEPGGMLRWGIPAYRLPRQILKKEIDYIKALGVKIETGVHFGKKNTLASLKRNGFKAVFLGIGTWRALALPVQGAQNNPNVIDSLTFLRQGSTNAPLTGKRVIVVGGGNVAVDCARTALRLDAEEVNLIYRRSKNEMPARVEEVKAAEEEGAILSYLSLPVQVHGENAKITGLECLRNKLSEPDATGRRRPVPIDGTEHFIPADIIISALGQRVDRTSLESVKALELSREDLIRVNPATMETSIPGVFAGGDAVTGPATVIEAVASGKKAAQSIHHYLQGLPYSDIDPLPVRRKKIPVISMSAVEKSLSSRPVMPVRAFKNKPADFKEVALELSAQNASQEAKRCLRCDLCISCGRCVEVCRDEMGVDALHLSYVNQNGTADTDFLRPSQRCVGCGACAINCPTNAIRIEEKDGESKIIMCGAEISRHPLVACAACGILFISKNHLDYIRQKTDAQAKIKDPQNLCQTCARKIRAENFLK
ncbi:MAG: FAD-dependent oxidoreductase [Desulfobacterales bacterium]|nr:FAD-dependent oxidoreductase [Desulfobacterales bacterium]